MLTRVCVITFLICSAWGSQAGAFEGENAYGPGVHMDRYGRAVQFRDEAGGMVRGRINRDRYGPGVSADEFGRPVRAEVLHGGGRVAPRDIPEVPLRGFTPAE